MCESYQTLLKPSMLGLWNAQGINNIMIWFKKIFLLSILEDDLRKEKVYDRASSFSQLTEGYFQSSNSIKDKAKWKWKNSIGRGEHLGETLCDRECVEGGVEVSQWEEKGENLWQGWLPDSVLHAPLLKAAGGARGRGLCMYSKSVSLQNCAT